MKLGAVDSKSWRDRRVSRHGLGLVRIHSDQDFLIDEEARPGHERSHPVPQGVRHAEDSAVPGDLMEGLAAAPQRQQLLAEVDQRSQAPVEVAVLVEEVAALRAKAPEPAAKHTLAKDPVRAA